jgi:hypothetical protein
MMAAGALVLSGAIVFGAATVFDNGGGGTQQPATAVANTTTMDSARSSTAEVAQWANDNGLVGGSPSGLRSVNRGDGVITQGEYSVVRNLETTEVAFTQSSGASGVALSDQGNPASRNAASQDTAADAYLVSSQTPQIYVEPGHPATEAPTTTGNTGPAGPR